MTSKNRPEVTDLQSLVSWYLSKDAEKRSTDPQEGLGLLQALTFQVAIELDQEAPDIDASAVSDAVDKAIQISDIKNPTAAVCRLNLMSVMLRRLPPAGDVAILNPDLGAQLFLDAIPIKIEQARALLMSTSVPTKESLRTLRQIKNLLIPITGFQNLILDRWLSRQIAQWAELLPQLP